MTQIRSALRRKGPYKQKASEISKNCPTCGELGSVETEDLNGKIEWYCLSDWKRFMGIDEQVKVNPNILIN